MQYDRADDRRSHRCFVLRTGIVAAPVLGLMTLALLSKGDRGDELGLSIFSFTTYPLLVLALLIAPALLAHSIVAERKLNTIQGFIDLLTK